MSNCFGRKPRIAVVGCSWFARAAHLPALQRLSEEGLVDIVALCSRTQESLSSAQKLIGHNVAQYTNFNEMLANEEIDLVDLVLPTTIIDSAIFQSLQAGKHVISEKPCANTVANCNALLANYNSCTEGQSWSVAENWLFKPSVMAIKNIINSNILGIIETIDFSYRSLGYGTGNQGWRTSKNFKGGYLLDSGVHFIRMLRYLSGGIKQVDASVGWHQFEYVANQVTSDMVYENNIKGTFIVDFTAGPKADDLYHLVIKCSGGILKANFLNNNILLQIGDKIQNLEFPNDSWVEGGVYSMLRHCCESLTNGTPTLCTPVEGLRDVATIEAMLQSNRIGCPVMPSLLHNQLNGCAYNIKSYDNLYISKPKHLVAVKSISDIQAALKESASNGLKVRAVGIGNNWTKYSSTTDVLIDISGMKEFSNINTHKKTIKISAGVCMRELTKSLAAHNLCLPSLPFLADGTLGGMVATGTHGTSPHWGTVSDSILSMSLVTSYGELVDINANSKSELLKAAKVSLGMLGIITEIELQAVDMKWVRNVKIEMSLDDFIILQSTIFFKYEHVWIHWLIGNEWLIVQCLETRDSFEDGFTPYVNNDVGNWVMQYHHTTKIQVGINPVTMSMQYGISLSNFADALRAINLSEFATTYSGREIELKFLKKSELSYLGPNSDDDVVLFNTFWTVDRDKSAKIFNDLEIIMQSYNGKPHWGKFHKKPSINYLKQSFLNWDKFDIVRREMDPTNMFYIFE